MAAKSSSPKKLGYGRQYFRCAKCGRRYKTSRKLRAPWDRVCKRCDPRTSLHLSEVSCRETLPLPLPQEEEIRLPSLV